MQTGFIKTEINDQHDRTRMPDIREIIQNKSLVANFQQIVSVSRKTVIGIEGLIRGVDPETNEIIPPNKLFDAARRENVALEFDRVCRDTVIEAFSKIIRYRHDKLLFLNLDASVLHNSVGSDYLSGQARQYGVDPRNIVIEISEKKAEGNAVLKRFADAYRKYGFMVALDDVGSESSNIDRILLIKPDIIKIDILLIKNIQNDFYKQGVFKSLVNMSNKIGALVIAEGSETEEEAVQILRLGGHMIQGFYFSEPRKFATEKAAFTNDKIDLLGRRFSEYMSVQYIEERKRNRRLNTVVNKVVSRFINVTSREFDSALGDIISQHSSMECAYILDNNGVQISDTICSAHKNECRENLIFYSARKGTDHSMEKYFYPLVSAGLKKHITQPYISLATGNLCITTSAVFVNTDNESYILCIDFRAGQAVNDIDLRTPMPNFGEGSDADMLGMLSRMNEVLVRDSLTDAYNRRYIEERLLVDVFNATNEERPISIILADIDHFKSVNDLFGHLAGDEVLKEFVRLSKCFIRKNSDWIARYGGDEFLIVLVNADEEAAGMVAEKIRCAVEEKTLDYKQSVVRFTASFGTYTVHSKKMTCDQLISQADKNLYQAKRAGRNKTVGIQH